MTNRIRLGISSCLMGEKVRYDGGHKLDRFLTDTLGQYVEYVPVCPEYECGLPVPREAMHLEGDPENPRLVTVKTKQDKTDQMTRWARRRVVELEKENLSGYIFKSKSPSSGMERVKVYNEKGMPSKNGVGMFARVFMEHFPLLPVEEEGRLHDPVLRENFVERVFALYHWRQAMAESRSRGSLVKFHTKNKLLILAHNQQRYREMGRLVARGRDLPLKELLDEYQAQLLEALKFKATPKKNANVLMHIMGYFKEQLSSEEKKELLDVIDLHRNGAVPLIVPITLANHYVRKYREPYLMEQTYLNPHPIELQLRNHV
ncbi:MAG: DUF1722 domain-containing protein [Acidobacteria bacterium]|nr:DUF1722 domain-containing protein [Acidobacteriota bacterium]